MRTLIVDDEPLARRGIALRLRGFTDVQVAGEAADGATALRQIVALTPDLVFLDIQMPVLDGFGVLRALPAEAVPAVIFLTAHGDHALQAFQIHALDYLLKPVDDERFVEAVTRAQWLLADPADRRGRVGALLDTMGPRYVERFPVRVRNRILVVPVEEVLSIGAAGDYAELHTRGRVYLIRETMATLERKLDPAVFVRIHRSRFIRGASIREARRIDNREYLLRLADGSEHRSSRSYAERVESWLA